NTFPAPTNLPERDLDASRESARATPDRRASLLEKVPSVDLRTPRSRGLRTRTATLRRFSRDDGPQQHGTAHCSGAQVRGTNAFRCRRNGAFSRGPCRPPSLVDDFCAWAASRT